MTGEIKYGGVALGVEAALPALARPTPRGGRLRRLFGMLVTALKRWV
jgi:hypothetical protein